MIDKRPSPQTPFSSPLKVWLLSTSLLHLSWTGLEYYKDLLGLSPDVLEGFAFVCCGFASFSLIVLFRHTLRSQFIQTTSFSKWVHLSQGLFALSACCVLLLRRGS